MKSLIAAFILNVGSAVYNLYIASLPSASMPAVSLFFGIISVLCAGLMLTEVQVVTQTRLLAMIFLLMAAVNLFLFFVDGFPNYGFAILCAASAMAAYLIHTKMCRSQS